MLENTIETDELIAGIRNAIAGSSEIVNKLALSTPINEPNGTPAKVNSIIPMSKIGDETGTRPVPLIGIRSGQMVRAGRHTFDVFVFIRCYTGLDKAFVENNEIMSLVNKLLDNKFITYSSAVTAEMVLEQLGGEDYDEGYKLNYREGQFRLTVT